MAARTRLVLTRTSSNTDFTASTWSLGSLDNGDGGSLQEWDWRTARPLPGYSHAIASVMACAS